MRFNTKLVGSGCMNILGQHGHGQYNMWTGGHHDSMGHVSMAANGPSVHTPPQNIWSRMQQHAQHNGDNSSVNTNLAIHNYVNNLKPNLDKIHIKSENRLSTDSQDSVKKKGRKLKQEEPDHNGENETSLDGQPPKKKGKGKGAKAAANKDPNAPKRQFICPHCNVSIL